MSTQATLVMEPSERIFPPLTSPRGALERLEQSARKLREHVRNLQQSSEARFPAAQWLVDHHSFIQFQIRETRRNLPASYVRELLKAGKSAVSNEPRIYRIAADLVAHSTDVIDSDAIASFGQVLREQDSLKLSELWAFGSILRLAIIERLCGELNSEPVVSACILSLRALDGMPLRDFVESVSAAEAVLRHDPAGVYARMDFATRDRYRHEVEKLARRGRLTEVEVAQAAVDAAVQARSKGVDDPRIGHVGYYLIGAGAKEFRKHIGCKRVLSFTARSFLERWPSFFYVGSLVLSTALIFFGFTHLAGTFPLWMSALLLIPVIQAALEIVNLFVSHVLAPRAVPSLDFSDGIPDSCRTMAVVPTLLLSAKNIEKLLEDLEIRYLANRDPNLFFGLLTDFSDAAHRETDNDSIVSLCVDGIHRLNDRYGADHSGPFYLFHRARVWNAQESRWMGHERKRGKLNDLNKLLQGRENWFDTVTGDRSRLREIRYVITLDTDTQLPRDTAAKMVGAMAHPLNRPVVDPRTGTVIDGYALIRPRVVVSMESAARSRLAQIFSGQPGFDPYATAVSDVYQDLHGQASFTGKGIYDVAAFDTAVGDRFPDNSILSHDLIEGEHARTGLLTGVELIEDYPASYRAFSKRKHRWVRGDWQLLPWLSRRPPVPAGRAAHNPLSLLSRWKVLDNLRRSLCEISLLLLLVLGWTVLNHQARWTFAILALLQLPAYVDILLRVTRLPEVRLWPAFAHRLGERFVQSHRDTILNLVFLPHQALLMADAILRTLVRRYFTGRKLLEWETMAQSESARNTDMDMLERYFCLSAVAPIVLLFALPAVNVPVALVCALWIVAPLMAVWLNQPPPGPAPLSDTDRLFLRDTALRTWRFFADHSHAEHHWLVPDNVQEDPPLAAHRISPTNLGLHLTSHLAAHDFGYANTAELSVGLRRMLDTMENIPRYRGHFYNWWETRGLTPLAPHYVSSVDSGNLCASLSVVRQGALLLLKQPVFGPGILGGLRDHVLRLREELPYAMRTVSTMRLLASLLRQLDCQPTDLFFWKSALIEARDMVDRVRGALDTTHARLTAQHEHAKSEELRYWELLLVERIHAALAELYELAPWLGPECEPELRINMRDTTLALAPLFSELSPVAVLAELPDLYERIRQRTIERLESSEPLYPALRAALQELMHRLPDARAAALQLIHRLEGIAIDAGRFFDDMDFRFLYDGRRKLLRVGYDVDAAQADESCYDLLASEARTAVFLAIAKGDIPREAWFHLGRKLTGYRNHRTLVSWSGTMFEYLMPLLHLKAYPNTLIDRGMRGAVRIQQVFAQERHIPWGISEAAYSARDSHLQYQYRAFGVPSTSARADRPENLVVAPYASMLALMLDPAAATSNLRVLAGMGCLERHGFIESIDYSAESKPEFIRCFMAHHQGMGLLAIGNALLNNRMQERFHLDPLVQATEFLLQERMPAMVEVLPE